MIRSFQWDLARQVERLDWLLAQLPRYADWGYDEVHLHLEDAVTYPSLPGVARPDAYSYADFERLVRGATRAGIKVVPIVNLLGHTQYLIKVPELRELNELLAPDGTPLERGQISPLHPRTLEIAEMLLRDMAPFCTAGKVHVGLDESFQLGRHPRSQAEIAEVGRATHFARYVNRLHGVTTALGLKMGLWADMLYFLPEAIPQLPPGITAYEWYYYPFSRRPRVELFNFAEFDLTTPLRQQGIERYGCPMNGVFRFEPLPHFSDRLRNIVAWWRHGRRTGAQGFLVSSWEPYRLAIELTTVVDAAAASLWLDPHLTDPREMLARGFARVSGDRARSTRPRARGVPTQRTMARRDGAIARDFAAADLALRSDAFPYAGYPRWEINERWDTISRREPLEAYRDEAEALVALANAGPNPRRTERGRVAWDADLLFPASLRASLEFRAALALRELVLRQLARRPRGRPDAAARAQGRVLERILQVALRAARVMWRCTRDRQVMGPNEQLLQADLERLKAWRRGDPVFGGDWQLCYAVWNFAPAVQRVGVEQQQPDGTWHVAQACHTIEFRSVAARPRGPVVREHAATVEWNGDRNQPPRLRLFVEGIGQVRVRDIALIGPGEVLRPVRQHPSRWIELGHPAPRGGWPDFANAETGARKELHGFRPSAARGREVL